MMGDTCIQLGRVGQIIVEKFAGSVTPQGPYTGFFTSVGIGAGGAPLTAKLLGTNSQGGPNNPGDPNGTGSATVFLSAGMGVVCFDLTASGVALPAFASHIHMGAVGVAGPVVVPFTALPNGHASGCTTGVSPSLIRSILANPSGYYVNVHNGPFPGGVIRGQLSQ
jgi:hypothetical protein